MVQGAIDATVGLVPIAAAGGIALQFMNQMPGYRNKPARRSRKTSRTKSRRRRSSYNYGIPGSFRNVGL